MDSSRRSARLGKYSLVAEIARGGMGIVYLAQAGGLHGFKKLVVVKQLKPELGEDEKFREMFLDEARLAAQLNHRNIVQTIEVDQDGDRYFFVMEYLEGRTLHAVSRLKGDKALSDPTFVRIVCHVLSGLHYAHELTDFEGRPLNVVHRDISPRNVFLTFDGEVKLLDFGVAKAAGRDTETQAGELKGRVPFMAPEHLLEASIDRRADVFSVGIVLREALTRRRVWEDLTEGEILRALLRKSVPPFPSDVVVSAEMRAIIDKAMAPERDERYQTAQEMRVALERCIGTTDAAAFDNLGETLSAEYASQRANVRAMVEQHVAMVESTPPMKGEVPMLHISSPDLSGSSASTPSSMGSVPLTPPSSSNVSAVRSSAANAKATPAAVSAPVEDIPIPPPRPRRRSKTFSNLLLGLGLLGFVGGLTVLLLSTRDPPVAPKPIIEPPPVSTPTGRRPVATPTVSAAPAEELIEVTVRASPATARLWIDDLYIGEGPHTQGYRRGSRHVVRASAPGYETASETITVTAMTSMNLVLEKEPEAGAPSAHPSGTHPPTSRPPAPRP